MKYYYLIITKINLQMESSIYYPSKINYTFIKNLYTFLEKEYEIVKQDIIKNINNDIEIKYILDNIIDKIK